MNITEEAVQAAIKAACDYYDVNESPSEMAMQAALTAALPFITGGKVKAGRSVCYVSKDGEAISDILDMPSDFIYDALKAKRDSEPTPSPREQALEEAALERSIERWRGMKPSEVMKGSTAQITYALEDARKDILTLYSALSSQPVANGRKFKLGDRLTKNKGSSWTGLVVGFYSTELTPTGYAIESETEKGSVQIYPEAALRPLPTPPVASE